jgi:hypothetical protein
MYSHYQDKYKWNDNTLKAIWWEAHGKAIDALVPKDRQLSKNFSMNGFHATHKNPNIISIGLHIANYVMKQPKTITTY